GRSAARAAREEARQARDDRDDHAPPAEEQLANGPHPADEERACRNRNEPEEADDHRHRGIAVPEWHGGRPDPRALALTSTQRLGFPLRWDFFSRLRRRSI